MNWISIDKKPPPGRSYLIRTVAAGPVYDVAFYNGRRPDGSEWWTTTDIEWNVKAITHWAEISEPDDL